MMHLLVSGAGAQNPAAPRVPRLLPFSHSGEARLQRVGAVKGRVAVWLDRCAISHRLKPRKGLLPLNPPTRGGALLLRRPGTAVGRRIGPGLDHLNVKLDEFDFGQVAVMSGRAALCEESAPLEMGS
jgi:hypothetical protein